MNWFWRAVQSVDDFTAMVNDTCHFYEMRDKHPYRPVPKPMPNLDAFCKKVGPYVDYTVFLLEAPFRIMFELMHYRSPRPRRNESAN